MARVAPPSRVHHVAIEVSDMERSIAFYRDLFGARVTENHAAGEVEAIPVALCFLRFNDDHHDLVLAHNPAKTYRQPGPGDALSGLAGAHHSAGQYSRLGAVVAPL